MEKLPVISYLKPKDRIADAVTAIIFNKTKNKILLAKRRDLPVWVAPGGMIEKDEPPGQAVIREIFEETGVKVKIVRKVAIYSQKGSSKKIYLFECKVISGKPTPQPESKEVRFVGINEIPKLIDPGIPIYLKDTLVQRKKLIRTILPSVNQLIDKKFILKHPIVAIRYKLLKLGIHINI